jgi:hypothetical protein
MEEDALKTFNARAATVTGKLEFAWEGDKIKLVIKFQIVMQVFTANSTLTRLFLHANLSFNKAPNATKT